MKTEDGRWSVTILLKWMNEWNCGAHSPHWPIYYHTAVTPGRSPGQESSGPSWTTAWVVSAGPWRDGLWTGAAGGPGFLGCGWGAGSGSYPPLSCIGSCLIFQSGVAWNTGFSVAWHGSTFPGQLSHRLLSLLRPLGIVVSPPLRPPSYLLSNY